MYDVGYSTPPKKLTLEQLNRRTDWFLLHPEFRRRLLAMMDASEGRVGFGGGWRSSASQELLFRTRYHVVPYTTGIRWDGKYWLKNPGVASAAPPGASFHEATLDGCALAADMIGDLDWVAHHCHEFMLREFSQVNNEPWHVQPAELPKARRTYEMNPAAYPLWTPPPPTPAPDLEEDEMASAFIAVQGSPGQYLWTPGSPPVAFTNPEDRDAILKALKIDPANGATISSEMFGRLA